MADAFKTTAKPYNGKMQPCKVCGKTPNEGDEMWMQNLGDDTNKKWIASPHEECFKKLQENPELGKKSGGGGRPFISQKHKLGDSPKILSMAEVLLLEFRKNRETEEVKLTLEQELQAILSFFNTLSMGYKP